MHSEKGGVSKTKIPLVILVYSIIGSMIAFGLLFLSAVLVWKEVLPEWMIGVLPAFCAFLGTMVSGFLSGKVLGRGLITGLIQGLFEVFLLYFLGILIFIRFVPCAFDLYLIVACVAGGGIGGFLSAGKMRKYRFKRK